MMRDTLVMLFVVSFLACSVLTAGGEDFVLNISKAFYPSYDRLLNNNDRNLNLQLALDWKALGFDDWRKVKIDDAVFHEGATVEDGKLLTPIGFVNMRMLVLEE